MLRAQRGPTGQASILCCMLDIASQICTRGVYSCSCDCAVAVVAVTISAGRTRATRAIGLHVTTYW